MSEKIKSKRAARRRRTTRRLTRKPIRVPEDKVPRSGASEHSVVDTAMEERAAQGSGHEFTSFSQPAPALDSQEHPRFTDTDPFAGEPEDDEDERLTISRPPPDPRALGAYHGDTHDEGEEEEEDEDSRLTISRPPPDPRALGAYDEDGREESDTRTPSPRPLQLPQSQAAAHGGDPLDGAAPDPPSPSTEHSQSGDGDAVDEGANTDPRIEMTEEMALAAGRLTSPEMPAFDEAGGVAESGGVETGSRERSDPPAVVVAPARVISDRPGPLEPPLASRLSPEEVAARARAIDALALAEEEQESHAKPSPRPRLEDADASVAVDDSMVLEETEAEAPREVRTPPPPPEATHKQAQAGAGSANGKAAAKRPPPPPRPRSQDPAPWWATFFNQQYVQSISRPTPDQVERQCDFICETLGLLPGMRVLDLGSGLGLQAIELARRGMRVTGVELSAAMRAAASELAAREGVAVALEPMDMREITYEEDFDAILLLGTSFGFFDDECHGNLLRRIRRALKTAGCLFVDVVNRDYVLSSQPGLVWYQGADCICMEETDFNYFTSRLSVKRTVMQEGGRQFVSDCSLRLYSLHELGQLIQSSGFRVREVSGQEETRGMFFGSHSMRMLFAAEKLAG